MLLRRRIRLLLSTACAVVFVVLALGLAACGGEDPGDGGAYKHLEGESDVVLRVTSGGGFVPVQYNLRLVPQFTLYGDGTIVVTGPTATIYPGMALPNLQAARVTEETIQAMLSAAQEAGLFSNGVDYGQPGITDVETTTITINVDGTTYASSIYALGIDGAGGQLTLEQQQARAAISQLVGTLTGVDDFEQGLQWASYQFTSLTVFSTPAPGDVPTDVQPNELDWPLGDLSAIGEPTQPEGFRKAVVTGADLEKLRPLLGQATEITIWNSGGERYNLVFRPLLPDETP